MDQLHQPGVIRVACQVPRFHVAMPKTGNQDDGGENDKFPFVRANIASGLRHHIRMGLIGEEGSGWIIGRSCEI